MNEEFLGRLTQDPNLAVSLIYPGGALSTDEEFRQRFMDSFIDLGCILPLKRTQPDDPIGETG